MKCWTRWLCLACLLSIGCNSKSSSSAVKSSEDGNVAATNTNSAPTKKKVVPVKLDVKDLIGNWVVVFTNQGSDSYRWIVKFSRGDEGKIVGEFLDTTQEKDEHDKPEFVETEVNGDAIRLVFKNEHGSFDFVGSFQQGFVRGTTRSSPAQVVLTRLLPTEETSLESFGVVGLPPGADVFDARLKSKDFRPDDLVNAIREFKTSPLSQEMYTLLISKHREWKFDETMVKGIIDDFLSSAKIWGERWEARTELVIVVNLLNGRQFAHLAAAHLDAAEQKLGEDKAPMQDSLNNYREACNVNQGVRTIMSSASTDESRAAAYTDLTEILKKQRFNAEILLALGIHAEKTGQVDVAIEYLSDIVALPLLELTIMQIQAGEPPDPPNERLKKLWKQKHGTEDGYDQHIAQVYSQKIGELISEIQKSVPAVPAADLGNKIVLVELFTGMMCPPCVAADLALGAIDKSFPHSEVIVVRYHQHIPLPDGLANQDSEERATFYEVASTPMIVIDGMRINPRFYSGPLQSTASSYGVLRSIIDSRMAEKTDVVIKLSAVVTNGQLDVAAEATGIPEDVLPSCRLRLAIVENHVETYFPLSSNGIRNHDFLVREILGGAKGIVAKNGELKYSSSMPVTDVKDHVAKYISAYEVGRRTEFPPPLKPPVQGPLSLVAWVQNGTPDKATSSRIILQSAVIPVTGETEFATTISPAASITTVQDSPPATTAESKSTEVTAEQTSESTPVAPALPE